MKLVGRAGYPDAVFFRSADVGVALAFCAALAAAGAPAPPLQALRMRTAMVAIDSSLIPLSNLSPARRVSIVRQLLEEREVSVVVDAREHRVAIARLHERHEPGVPRRVRHEALALPQLRPRVHA